MMNTLTERLRWIVDRRHLGDHEPLFATYGYKSYHTSWWRKRSTDQQWRERTQANVGGIEAETDTTEAFEDALAWRHSSFERSGNQEEARVHR